MSAGPRARPASFRSRAKNRLIVHIRLTCGLCAASFPARVRLQSGVVCRNLGAALVLCAHRSLHPGWQQQPQVPCVCVAVREAAARGSGRSAVLRSAVLRLPARLGAACVLCRCLAGVVLTVGSNQGVARRGPLAWRRGYHGEPWNHRSQCSGSCNHRGNFRLKALAGPNGPIVSWKKCQLEAGTAEACSMGPVCMFTVWWWPLAL